MAIDEKDVGEVAKELKGAFDDFKAKNDKELEAIKSEKGKLSDSVDKLNEKLGEIDKLKSDLEKELKAAKRPGATEGKDVEAHQKAFGQFLRKGKNEDELADLQQKAVQVAVDGDGGFAAPEELDTTMLELLRNESPMREVCGSIIIGASGYKKLVNLGGAGSGWVGEIEARPATGTPTIAQLEVYMGELYSNPQATQQSLDDIHFNVEQWLSEEVAREFAEQEGNAFLLGNGTNKPKGILAYDLDAAADKDRVFGKLQKLVSGAAGSFTGDNLIDLIYSTKKGYRKNAQFMMNTLTLCKARKLKDSEGNYLWQPGLQAGQPSTLLSHAVAENEDMPDAEADANAILFGDFKRGYAVVDRFGTRVLRDPFTNKPNVGFYTTKRVGGMLLDSNAIKVLALSA